MSQLQTIPTADEQREDADRSASTDFEMSSREILALMQDGYAFHDVSDPYFATLRKGNANFFIKWHRVWEIVKLGGIVMDSPGVYVLARADGSAMSVLSQNLKEGASL